MNANKRNRMAMRIWHWVGILVLLSVSDLHAMLVETTGIARPRMAAGKTLEQIKTEGLPEKWKDWGTGLANPDRWLEIVHRSLSRSPS